VHAACSMSEEAKKGLKKLRSCADGRSAIPGAFMLGQYGPINALAQRLNEVYLRFL